MQKSCWLAIVPESSIESGIPESVATAIAEPREGDRTAKVPRAHRDNPGEARGERREREDGFGHRHTTGRFGNQGEIN